MREKTKEDKLMQKEIEIREEKKRVRKRVLERLIAHKPEEKRRKDSSIEDKILASDFFKEAASIMFYVSFGYEVETKKIIKQALIEGKEVVVPFIEHKKLELLPSKITDFEKDIVRGKYGIMEPRKRLVFNFEKKILDMVLVPGVAFDRAQNRLGRGFGYYDRFLSQLDERTKKVGLAYDIQIEDALPVAAHDIPLDLVVTN